MVNVLSPMVNQLYVVDIVGLSHTAVNTNPPLMRVLAAMAINDIMPDVDFFPRMACITNAKRGNNTTRMLIETGDIVSKSLINRASQ